MTKLQVRQVLKAYPEVRIADAKMASPERADLSPAYNIFSDEWTLDQVEALAQDEGWKMDRVGPKQLWVDPDPDYVNEIQGNYQSIWED
jgi:hypothetical protein